MGWIVASVASKGEGEREADSAGGEDAGAERTSSCRDPLAHEGRGGASETTQSCGVDGVGGDSRARVDFAQGDLGTLEEACEGEVPRRKGGEGIFSPASFTNLRMEEPFSLFRVAGGAVVFWTFAGPTFALGVAREALGWVLNCISRPR
uniref:Uncharacterized protein n=1 Tax=Chromera velia CCMP2878 TaxID=1169474 RepID=A0A0G4GNV8_9ALVE|eukprot:Cvel_22713.t1-p1 / transcript=Cvel_22713.t1 / gene=Cvel_22713 / organism=Chromera_velia_CCMP2878 / gene_product=hypothetical protein / transcript_product=hypothetical protein / location=Cvel_scaffold2262:30576-31019(-) / protein_length=148 / sequence_SO=supercontig / SO=protein_coding / is_pseudo=false